MDRRVRALSAPELDLFTAIRSADASLTCSILLNREVNPSVRDDTGHTLLGVAASGGFHEGVKALLEVLLCLCTRTNIKALV